MCTEKQIKKKNETETYLAKHGKIKKKEKKEILLKSISVEPEL